MRHHANANHDAASTPASAPASNATPASRPEVLIFATGGTIGMHETQRGLAADPNFEAALDEMVAGICAPLHVDFRINHLSPSIDSANADAETGARIARAVRARVRTKRPSGVVITHGTDTLAYTGARIAFELAGLGVPVVLTGSQFAHGANESDAPANLSLAIRTALRANAGSPACIAFGGEIMPAIRATKAQAEDLRAFRAERRLGGHPIGVPKQMLQGSTRSTPARTISFRFVPGVTTDDLRAAVGGAPDGLVLECYGAGNAPMARPGMAQALRDICASMPVVAITQCATGAVDPNRYAIGGELADTGVISGGDMTVEATLAKLAFLLDAGLQGEDLRAQMQHNLVGERSS